jgi:hypothetical protein
VADATHIPARPLHDGLLVLLFLGALSAPWVDELVRSDEERGPRAREHREPSQRPALQLEPRALYKFPAAYEAYFEDSFGLRDVLLRWHSLQSLRVFDVSPTSELLLGKQGWYFYTGNSSVEIWRGLRPFSQEDLRQWQLGLEARRNWLRGLGIRYLFVLAPNKETVYPDYMPDSLERLGPTRLDQFAEYLARHSDVDFLDLRPAMAEARKQDAPQSHLYLEEGTHWNARGSLTAYRAILERLAQHAPLLAPLPPEAWQQVEYGSKGDTWASNMYIGDLSKQREFGLMRPPGQGRARQLNAGKEGPFGFGRKHLSGTTDPSQPRAMLFHDSFGNYVEPLLAEHFSALECVWTYDFDALEVLDFRPRVVIELWVERTLASVNPRTLAPKIGERAESEFARARQQCLELDPARAPLPETLGKLELERTSDESGAAFRLQTRGAGDSLLLPELACGPEARPLVRIAIDSPQDCNLDIFYLLEGETEYTRAHNCLVPLSKGHNDVCVRMPEAGIVGRLRLRPAFCATGAYLLRALEIRSTIGG